MNTITKKNNGIIYLFICLFLNILFPQSLKSEEATLLLPPKTDYKPADIHLFVDKNNNTGMVYKIAGKDCPDELYYMINKGSVWSNPVTFAFPNRNEKIPCDIRNLGNGTPVLILVGDDTDYASLFNLEDNGAGDPVDLSIPGVSEEEIADLLFGNQRLFSSFYLNERWTQPVPVKGTNCLLDVKLETGTGSSALAVFSKDTDRNPDTSADRELFASAFYQNGWTAPMQLSHNNMPEYGIQLAFINDRYVVIWVVDEDNNSATTNDRQVYSIPVDQAGKCTGTASIVPGEPAGNGFPVLGVYQNRGVLLWNKEQTGQDDQDSLLMVSSYTTTWSSPVETGLKNIHAVANACLAETAGSLLFTYTTTEGLNIAACENNTWYDFAPLLYWNQIGLAGSEIDYSVDPQGTVRLAIAGHIPDPATSGANDGEADGIYYKSISFLPDLAFGSIGTGSVISKTGSSFKLDIPVINKGYIPSRDYEISIKSANEVIKTLKGTALPPGGTQVLSAELVLENVTVPYAIEISTTTSESRTDNNKTAYTARLLPDYLVKSVECSDAVTIEAEIAESKGIIAPSVAVDFYLQRGSNMAKIHTATFDPVVPKPVIFSYPDLAAFSEPYTIIAEINGDRLIKEDNYFNNKEAFVFNPLPDFIIQNMIVTAEYIEIKTANIGAKSSGNVELILTEDPLAAFLPASDTAWLCSREISFSDAGELSIRINRSELPSITGRNLYAFVNPFNNIEEEDQDNNFYKVLLIKGESIGASLNVELSFSRVMVMNGVIFASVKNTGTSTALLSKVELLDMRKTSLRQIIIPAIKSRETEWITFKKVAAQAYILRLTYTGAGNTTKQAETIVNVPLIIEAERMKLVDYYRCHAHHLRRHHNEIIRTKKTGTAQAAFAGADGIYDITIVYFDEEPGKAEFQFFVDDLKIDQWIADENEDEHHRKKCSMKDKDEQNTRVIRNVTLKTGSTIRIIGKRDKNDFASLDCIEIYQKTDKGN